MMMPLTREEIQAAACCKIIDGRWGQITNPGPAMAIATLRGADWETLGEGWVRPASARSLCITYDAQDDLAEALGYESGEALTSAEHADPKNVRKKLAALARRSEYARKV
jgi:hypothetical protein